MVKKEPTTTELMAKTGEVRMELQEVKSELQTEMQKLQAEMRAGFHEMREMLEFVHEHAATKEDLKLYATKEDLQEFRSDIIGSIDQFAKTQIKFDHELTALRGGLNRHEERIETVEAQLRAA